MCLAVVQLDSGKTSHFDEAEFSRYEETADRDLKTPYSAKYYDRHARAVSHEEV